MPFPQPADARCRRHRTSGNGRGSPPRTGSEEGQSAAQQSNGQNATFERLLRAH